MDRLLARMDRALPPEIRGGDPDTLRRGRLLLLFLVVLIAPGLAFDVALAAEGAWLVTAACALAHVAIASVALVLWRTRSIPTAAHTLLALMVLNLSSVLMLAGGLTGGAAPSLSAVPLVATLLINRRAGAAWLAIVSTVPALVLAMSAAGHEFSPPATGLTFLANLAGGFVCLYAVTYGLGAAFDSAWTRAHDEASARERDVRRLLDHIGQGFITVNRAGVVVGPHSAALVGWFGVPRAGQTLAEYVGGRAPRTGQILALEFEALIDDQLPDELILDQMPRRFRVGATTIGLEVRPLPDSDDFLAILSDVTAATVREQHEALQREMVAVTERALRDPRGLELLLSESGRAMEAARRNGPQLFRAVHTLKGNMGMYGVTSVASLCHDLESRLVERAVSGPPALEEAELEELEQAWSAFSGRAAPLVRRRDGLVEVPRRDLRLLQDHILARVPAESLVRTIDGWEQDPPDQSLGRLAAAAQAQAERLGKGELDIHVDSDGWRTPASWAPLWAAMVHVVTNAVDHGIESPEQRRVAGKRAIGSLVLSMRLDGPVQVLRVSDDGAGVRWAAVAAAAAAHGLPHESEADLVAALFADRVTTRTSATEFSGRGVGLAAVHAAVAELGGQLTLRSVPGQGTTVEVRVPRPDLLGACASA